VAHRELQFELRDHRLISQLAVQRFGYPSSRFHGRFIKGEPDDLHLEPFTINALLGDLRSNEFACGGRDGCVRLWDMRNLKDPSTTVSGIIGQNQLCGAHMSKIRYLASLLHRKLYRWFLTSLMVNYW